MGQPVTFLHLSDIHFHKQSDSIYCLDKALRHEMILDAKDVIGQESLKPYGIILCGDIAFSGQSKEYDIADSFINDLVHNLNIEMGHVFCVPGNHDVDQNIVKKSVPVYAVQKLLEESDHNNFQRYLDILKEEAKETGKDILYMPLKNYNEFSGKYMGNVSSVEDPWTYEIEMDGGYVLCLYGINSTIISNMDDHADKEGKSLRKMRVGKHQIPMRRKKVIYMTMCHHPTDIWGENIAQALDERAMVQLYGHKHVQTLETNGKSVKIGTGALQPDRREEGWQPRYNFLSVGICQDNLEILLYPRIWDDTIQKFVSDESICDEGYHFKKIVLPVTDCGEAQTGTDENSVKKKVRETDDRKRKLVYKLWELQPYQRGQVLRQFEAFCDIKFDDLNQSIEEILRIAEKNNLIEKVIEEIEK